MFGHTVVPILTYACEILGYENFDMIEKVQNDFLRHRFQRKYAIIYAIWRVNPVRNNHKIKNDRVLVQNRSWQTFKIILYSVSVFLANRSLLRVSLWDTAMSVVRRTCGRP